MKIKKLTPVGWPQVYGLSEPSCWIFLSIKQNDAYIIGGQSFKEPLDV